MLNKNEMENIVKEVVPDLVRENAKKNRYYDEDSYEVENIDSFNGDSFQEFADGAENDDYIIKEEETFGGYEGAGEETWIVYSLLNKKTQEKIYFEINGYYNSWDGTEWNNWAVVKPKEVKKIIWVGV